MRSENRVELSWTKGIDMMWPFVQSNAGCPRARLEEGLEKMEAAYKAAVAAGKMMRSI